MPACFKSDYIDLFKSVPSQKVGVLNRSELYMAVNFWLYFLLTVTCPLSSVRVTFYNELEQHGYVYLFVLQVPFSWQEWSLLDVSMSLVLHRREGGDLRPRPVVSGTSTGAPVIHGCELMRSCRRRFVQSSQVQQRTLNKSLFTRYHKNTNNAHARFRD